MAFEDPEFIQRLKKYGPRVSSNIADVERTVATASGRQPRPQQEMLGQNFSAIAGSQEAMRRNQQLNKEASELADQYRREARGMADSQSSIPQRMLNALGLKHGGKVSTAETNKKQKRW